MRVIIDGARDPQYNMAIDEALLLSVKDEAVLRLYSWLPSGVSIGRGQSVRDVNLEEIRKLGFKLVRRPTGGSALLHPEFEEITYSIVIPKSHKIYSLSIEDSSIKIAKGIEIGLRKLGLDASVGSQADNQKISLCYLRKGYSDVLIRGKKVSGSAQVRNNNGLLQHGTLLLKFRPDVWLKVIRVNDIELLNQRISGLYDIFGYISTSSLISYLIEGFSEALGEEISLSSLSKEEVEVAERLYKEKYSRDGWNISGEKISILL